MSEAKNTRTKHRHDITIQTLRYKHVVPVSIDVVMNKSSGVVSLDVF